MERQFYTLFELAERLQIPMSTARRLARENAFPGMIQLGKQTFRFSKFHVDKWLDDETKGRRQDNA